MYENEIEALRDALVCEILALPEKTAIMNAITLMRAAQPKDESAEREHCERSVYAAPIGMIQREEWLRRERAAARAEVQAQVVAERAELCILRKDVADWKARALAAEAGVIR